MPSPKRKVPEMPLKSDIVKRKLYQIDSTKIHTFHIVTDFRQITLFKANTRFAYNDIDAINSPVLCTLVSLSSIRVILSFWGRVSRLTLSANRSHSARNAVFSAPRFGHVFVGNPVRSSRPNRARVGYGKIHGSSLLESVFQKRNYPSINIDRLRFSANLMA